jgi:hypothetical protein
MTEETSNTDLPPGAYVWGNPENSMDGEAVRRTDLAVPPNQLNPGQTVRGAPGYGTEEQDSDQGPDSPMQ